ncbi:MAG TPA: transglutaminase-like domain-containing protein [Soehngenia sp.]|nr:transglutaminase-like domain-containing protein [Soehngenia sp.]HPP31204.1 transglutaminase-like domain-containing protein [Soehngenia sp.]
MSKKLVCLFLCLLIMFNFHGVVSASSDFSLTVLENRIKVESTEYGKGMRLMVQYGNNKYYYSIGNDVEYLPIQFGKGTYEVKLLRNIEGNRYSVVDKKYLNISEEPQDVYLSSSQPVLWENNEELLALAKDIIKDKNTDEEKVKAVYDYIVSNIKYDKLKIKNLPDDYVPNLNTIIKDKKGICYDYSALFAGILRSEGIPCKLVKGYKNDLKNYHAWNEVYLDGKWQIVDTTYDSAYVNKRLKVSMLKADSDYNKVREY